jgi:hypothetical protein
MLAFAETMLEAINIDRAIDVLAPAEHVLREC